MSAYVVHPLVHENTEERKGEQEKEGCQTNLSEYILLMDKRELERTVRFIRGAFLKQADKVQQTIEVCTFHSALAFDAQFVRDVLERLDAKEARFAVTASVSKNTGSRQHYSWDYGEESFHSLEKKVFTNKLRIKETGHVFGIPLGFVAFGGKAELLPLLYECGVRVDETDALGNNIVHIIVEISDLNAERATAMYEAIVKRENIETRKRLLLHLNHDGMTPLDIASDRHLPEMTYSILNTIGVFKFPLREHALDAHMLYDITGNDSILQGISLATEKELKRFDEFHLFEREPFKSWIEETINFSHKAVLHWMSIWVVIISGYITCMLLVKEGHASKTRMDVGVIIIASLLLTEELVCLCTNYNYMRILWTRLRKGKIPFTFVWGYKLFQVNFALLIIVHHSVSLSHIYCNHWLLEELYALFQVILILCGFNGIMFFTQLNRSMGHYLTIVEKMLTSSLAFFLMSLLFLLGFSMAFYLLKLPVYCFESLGSISNNSSLTRGEDEGYIKSVYNTLLLGLAIAAPKDWYFKDYEYSTLATLYYLACLVIIAITMMNLLIAIMNERVIDLCKHKYSILTIQRLAIHLTIREQQKVFERFPLSRPCARLFLPLESNIHVENGRCFLHTVELYKEG